jgi:large subunit ribosomal protein L13
MSESLGKQKIVIDATNSIAGRLGTYAAKQALLGNQVIILNSEKAIMTGDRKKVFAKYQDPITNRGQPTKGPFFRRPSDRFLRRIIRGMLPWTKTRGREAYRRIMCYVGVPEEFKDLKAEKVKGAEIEKLTTLKYVTIQELCKHLGAKV